eukprot:4076463-Amphidinium_carterae.1
MQSKTDIDMQSSALHVTVVNSVRFDVSQDAPLNVSRLFQCGTCLNPVELPIDLAARMREPRRDLSRLQTVIVPAQDFLCDSMLIPEACTQLHALRKAHYTFQQAASHPAYPCER